MNAPNTDGGGSSSSHSGSSSSSISVLLRKKLVRRSHYNGPTHFSFSYFLSFFFFWGEGGKGGVREERTRVPVSLYYIV